MTDSEAKREAAIEARSTIYFAVDQIEALSQCGICHIRDWDMYGLDNDDAVNNLEMLLRTIRGLIKPLMELLRHLIYTSKKNAPNSLIRRATQDNLSAPFLAGLFFVLYLG